MGQADPGEILDPADDLQSTIVMHPTESTVHWKRDGVGDDELGYRTGVSSEPLFSLSAENGVCCRGPDVSCLVTS